MNVHTQNTCTYIVTLNKGTVVLHKIECIDRCNEIIYSKNKSTKTFPGMNLHTQNTYIVTLNKGTVVLHKIECIDRCNKYHPLEK